MAAQPEQLRARTKQFAIRIVRLFKSLPKTDEARNPSGHPGEKGKANQPMSRWPDDPMIRWPDDPMLGGRNER